MTFDLWGHELVFWSCRISLVRGQRKSFSFQIFHIKIICHSSLCSERQLVYSYPLHKTRNKISTEVTISPFHRATFSHNALFQGTILRQILRGAIAIPFYVIQSIWRHVRPTSWQIQNGGTGNDQRQCACPKSMLNRGISCLRGSKCGRRGTRGPR